MATMQKIAKIVGVSQATVSRVMRGQGSTSKELADRILQAAREVGYSKHLEVHGPKGRKRTGYVGLLTLGVHQDIMRLPHIADLVVSLERILSRYSFQLVLNSSDGDGVLPPMVNQDRLDGIFVIGRAPAQIQARLSEINCVLLLGGACGSKDTCWADWVTANYYKIGYMAAQYLIDRDHHNIAFLNMTSGNEGLIEAEFGFRRACENDLAKPVFLSELAGKDDAIWDAGRYKEGVHSVCLKLLKMSKKDRPTGLLVSEYMAIKPIYEVMASHGIKPGRDFEVISRIHEESYLSTLTPRPASIVLSRQEMAEQAVQRLLYRMSSSEETAGTRIMVAPGGLVKGKGHKIDVKGMIP